MNGKKVVLVIVAVAMMVMLAFFFRDELAPAVQCADGMRNPATIDNFTIKYWTNSAKLEASIANKGILSEKLGPTRLQSVSDALQQANKFRKFVVAGFNSCAITKSQYAEYSRRYQELDSLSKRINSLVAAPKLTDSDDAALIRLIDELVVLGQQFSKNSMSQ